MKRQRPVVPKRPLSQQWGLFRELSALGNDVFKTREYRNFLSVKLTRKRAAYYIFERSHFHLNRRQCWALVQARAPFDIKQLIWHHEMEELEGDKERGVEKSLDAGLMLPDADGVLAPLAEDLCDLLEVSRLSFGGDSIVVEDLRDAPLCERSRRRDATVCERANGMLLSDRDWAVLDAG